MGIYHLGWKNRLRALYEQYMWLDELQYLQPKLYKALNQYEKLFDDDYTYEKRLARKTGRILIVRRPFWLGWQRRVDAEKINHSKDPYQQTLI